MLLNLRAKCINNNGAYVVLTWRNTECTDEQHGHALAKAWGEANDKEWKSSDVGEPYQLNRVETEILTDAQLEEEDEYWRRDNMDSEIYHEDYDY